MKVNFKSKFPNLNLQAQRSSPLSSMISCLSPSAPLRSNKKNTCINYWEISDLLRSFFTEDPMMAGITLTFTLDVTTRGLPFPCLRSKTVIASEVTPSKSGHLNLKNLFLILSRWYLTYLAAGTSLGNKIRMALGAQMTWDLLL